MPNDGALTIAQALKAANFDPPAIAGALIAPEVYPALTAQQVGQALLDPSMFPALTRDQVSAALTAAPFPAAAVTAALVVLFPAAASPWQQAPLLVSLGASQLGGGQGGQLWGIDPNGKIWTTRQPTPGGSWTPWSGPGFTGQNFVAKQIAVAGQNTGNLQLWALDGGGMLYAIAQTAPGGAWGAWSGPNFHGQPGPLSFIAAAEQKGNRGVELWAVDARGAVWTIYQLTPGGAWSSWEGPGFKNQPGPLAQFVAAGQNTGSVYGFGIDGAGAVRGIPQGSPGGDWGGWTGANMAGQPANTPMTAAAASMQSGNRGVELWTIDNQGRIWTLYQLTPGGAWSSWEGPGFKGQPVPMKALAAAQQGNGCCLVFTLDANNQIWVCPQGSPGGDWGAWHPAAGQRLPPLTG